MNLDDEIEDIIRSRAAAWPDIIPILRADGPFHYFLPAVRMGLPGLFICVGKLDEAGISEMSRIAIRGYAVAVVEDGAQLREAIDTYMMLGATEERH